MPLLNKLLNHPPLQALIHGGKGVGSQGDGTAQFLCRSEEVRGCESDATSEATKQRSAAKNAPSRIVAFSARRFARRRCRFLVANTDANDTHNSHIPLQAVTQVQDVISRDFPDMSCLPLTLEPTGKIRKAVVLAAGFGTQHYPATAAMSMAFLPLVVGGVTKPALLLHIEDLDEAGVEEIAIVCQPGDVPTIRNLFHNKLSAQNFSKLSAGQKEYAKRLR